MATKKKQSKDYKMEAAWAVELLTKAEHIDKKKLYLQNFLRGIFVGAGSVIGATLLIAILLWALSLFDMLPFIGPIIENARQTIDQT